MSRIDKAKGMLRSQPGYVGTMTMATTLIDDMRLAAQRLNDEVDMYWNGCRTDAQVKRINEAQQALRKVLHD